MRSLERSHPLICFTYIISVLAVTIFTRNPLLLIISACGAALLLILSENGKAVLWLPAAVAVSALINPVFSHNGNTVLFFVSHLPITLESFAYGADFGLMLAASVGWSIAAVRFITSDKFIWLFGRILPVCGLVLSCSLRLVPLFIKRAGDFSAAQDSHTLKGSLKAFSASVGYSAEEAMTSADSMRARGYGTAKRTSYSLYHFGRSEALQLFTVLVLGAASIVLCFSGAGNFTFYPVISALPCSASDILLYAAFAALSLLPSIMAVCENIRRRKITSPKGALK